MANLFVCVRGCVRACVRGCVAACVAALWSLLHSLLFDDWLEFQLRVYIVSNDIKVEFETGKLSLEGSNVAAKHQAMF